VAILLPQPPTVAKILPVIRKIPPTINRGLISLFPGFTFVFEKQYQKSFTNVLFK
jgi:hypothetical protein